MSSSSIIKLLQAILLLGAIGFLIVEAGDRDQNERGRIGVGGLMVVNGEGVGNMKQVSNMGQRNSKLEINFISKRTVPTGPDPIHNKIRNSKLEINFISKRTVPTGPDPLHNKIRAGEYQPPPRHA